MANPFLRRATEYIRDPEAFLSVVSPSPLTTFLAQSPYKNELFSHPMRIIGSPGTGKTMLATLAEFKMVETILRDVANSTNRPLANALADAGFVSKKMMPNVAAVRIPMESEYRAFWELPYDPTIKTKLAFRLLQARAMLALIRDLTASGERSIENVRFIPRADYEAHLDQIGGLSPEGIKEKALAVQRAIYIVGAGLRPPPLDQLPQDATAPYAPFDAIEAIEIDWDGAAIQLHPLAMLDDMHELHHDQLDKLFGLLSHREMRFGRWMMMRLDALSPGVVLRTNVQPTHNRTEGRDFIDISMQVDGDKGAARTKFRKMASDMANKYLPRVEIFANRETPTLANLLPKNSPKLSAANLRNLNESLDKVQDKLKISASRRKAIEDLVADYAASRDANEIGDDIAAAMCRILMHRYDKRREIITPSLFEGINDPEPSTPLKATRDVSNGARIHLHHEFGRPLHYGIEALCDASNENAEVFLQYTGDLVAEVETRLIRRKSLAIPVEDQQRVLRHTAQTRMQNWAFSMATLVRGVVDAISDVCLNESLLPNAPLDQGAMAAAILESEFSEIPPDSEVLMVLKQAVAHGAINIERNYGQGGKHWCLIELTGTVSLAKGLTMIRGGFVKEKVAFLEDAIGQTHA